MSIHLKPVGGGTARVLRQSRRNQRNGGDCSVSTLVAWLQTLSIERIELLVPSIWATLGTPGRLGRVHDWRAKMAASMADYRACSERLGGRFWTADVAFMDNFTYLTGGGYFHRPSWIRSKYQRKSFCAPSGCVQDEVREIIIPLYWYLAFYGPRDDMEKITLPLLSDNEVRPIHSHLAQASSSMSSNVEEFGSWEELNLSWVILGYEGCGTTSLAANLHQHHSLELLCVQGNQYLESSFFMVDWPDRFRVQEPPGIGVNPRYLPFKSEVEIFNGWTTKADEPTQRLRGIKMARYIEDDVSLSRLALIPRIKAIVIIEDPVVRIERSYLKHVEKWRVHEEMLDVPSLGACIGRACGPLRYSTIGFFDPSDPTKLSINCSAFRISERVRSVAVAFGFDNLFLADRGDLKQEHALFNSLASFLGTSSFPEEAGFGIYNERHQPFNDRQTHMRSTSTIRSELMSSGPRAQVHKQDLNFLKSLFSSERRALHKLFSVLSPERGALGAAVSAVPSSLPRPLKLPDWLGTRHWSFSLPARPP